MGRRAAGGLGGPAGCLVEALFRSPPRAGVRLGPLSSSSHRPVCTPRAGAWGPVGPDGAGWQGSAGGAEQLHAHGSARAGGELCRDPAPEGLSGKRMHLGEGEGEELCWACPAPTTVSPRLACSPAPTREGQPPAPGWAVCRRGPGRGWMAGRGPGPPDCGSPPSTPYISCLCPGGAVSSAAVAAPGGG